MMTQHFLTVAKRDSKNFKSLALNGFINTIINIPQELENVNERSIIIAYKEERERQKEMTGMPMKHLRTPEEYAQLIEKYNVETEDEWYKNNSGISPRIIESEAFKNDTYAFYSYDHGFFDIFLKDIFLSELSAELRWLYYEAKHYEDVGNMTSELTRSKKAIYIKGFKAFKEEGFYSDDVNNILKGIKSSTIKPVDINKFRKAKNELIDISSLPF